MITLTQFERQLHRALLERVRGADRANPLDTCLSYLELSRIVDPQQLRAKGPQPNTSPPFRGLNIALGHVSWYEHDRGRPWLSAVVVNADTRQPGPGFVELVRQRGVKVDDPEVFWRSEVARIVDFWSTGDVVQILDSALDRVLVELADIKKLLR